MVLKFDEYINEGFLSKTYDRYRTGELRKEDGQKVKTVFGIEIVLHNPNYNYDKLIEYMLDAPSDDDMGIDIDSLGNYEGINNGRQIIAGIKKGDDPYRYLIDGHYVASFDSYEDVKDFDISELDIDVLDEHDYIQIIKSIVEVLKQTDLEKSNERTSYGSEVCLLLMDESKEWDYECKMNDTTRDFFWDDFKSWFEEKFEDAELKTWSYNNYGSSIGVSVNYNNLLNYQEMKSEVEEYYKYTVENQEEDDEL